MASSIGGSQIMPTPTDRVRSRAGAYVDCAICGLIILLIGLVYSQTLDFKLLYFDDASLVSNNFYVAQGFTFQGVWWAFSDGPFGDWYPLAMLSHMLDCQLFGMNAWGHHLTNLLLHTATSLALFFVCQRLLGQRWPSALVALLFAVHPQHVESVAWIAERRDVLSGLFFVLTLWAYLGYARHGQTLARYLLVMLMLACGLLSKQMLVTVPPLLLLLDYWPLGRFGTSADAGDERGATLPTSIRLLLEKLPLALMAAGVSLLALRKPTSPIPPFAWPARFENAAISTIAYIADLFYPAKLVAFYGYPEGGFSAWQVSGAVVLVAAVSLAAVVWLRRYPELFVGWFWYLGMLTPVLGFVTISNHIRADRYVYLPSIGLFLALAWAGTRLVTRWPQVRWPLAGGAVVAVAALTVCSVEQASFWRDDETLWRHVLACDPSSGKAEFCLADALARLGRADEAIDYFLRAEKHPIDPAPFINLGVIYAGQGKPAQAIWQYLQALAMEPDFVAAHVNLGVALVQTGQEAEAKEHFLYALKIEPRSMEAHCGLGHVLLGEGKPDEARAELERAIEINTRSAAVHNEFALILLQQGDTVEARRQCEAALALDPNFYPAQQNLAKVLVAERQSAEATTHYQQVMEVDPYNDMSRHDLIYTNQHDR
jgi:protein O-mannosyl-transferase